MDKTTAELRADYLTEEHGSETCKFRAVRLGDVNDYYADNPDEYGVAQVTRSMILVIETEG
jgi:hypothetical protein